MHKHLHYIARSHSFVVSLAIQININPNVSTPIRVSSSGESTKEPLLTVSMNTEPVSDVQVLYVAIAPLLCVASTSRYSQ